MDDRQASGDRAGATLPEPSCVEHAPHDVACLHELFERQADKSSDRPAVIRGSQSLSYRELDERANQLARYLRLQGVETGDLVALYLDRSPTAIVALLACLKAGAGYVPIDPIYPPERIRFILEHARVAAVLTEEALLTHAMGAYSGRIVTLDRDWPRVAGQPTTRPTRAETGISGDALAYVIYTSGTTGRPKGVMTEHRSVVHFVSSFNEVCNVTEADRIYQGFSLSFDGSVEEIWMALAHGASLIVPPVEIARIGSEVGRLLNDSGATVFSTVPTMLSTIDAELPSVRLLIVSGEVCTPDVVRRWARPGCRMLNVYGPTETTVNATVAECLPDRPVTIGRPLTGYLTYILDESLRPVADGASGELYIGGPGLARGYFDLPELTATHFIPNPIVESRAMSSRLYKTGDLARVTEQGTIDYLGRLDGQVKVRGFRVELGEIESVLREDPAVVMAVVTVTDRGGPQLAAYVTVEPSVGPLDRDSVLQRLRSRLPDYMVPAYLDVLDEFPTLASGKVERRALPAPVEPLVRGSREIVPPGTDAERLVLGVWERALKVSPISVTDNFFTDLGGHSLLAAQTVSALRRDLGLEVAVRDIYQWPTIEDLAAHSAPTTVAQASDVASRSSSRATFHSLSWGTRLLVPLLQAISIYLLSFVTSWQLIVTVCLVLAFLAGWVSIPVGVGLLAALVVVAHPVTLLLSVAAKWLLIGRYKAGRHPIWGWYYLRWWLVERLTAAANPGSLTGTPLMNVYFRLMGAKVGAGAIIDTPYCCAFDLIQIGRGAAIGADTHILGYRVEDGMLLFGRVTLGDGCYVGLHSSLGLNTRMGKGSRLGDLSLLEDGAEIPDGESRVGSPAISAKIDLPRARHSGRWAFLYGCGHLIALVTLELLVGLAALPVLALVVAGVVQVVLQGVFYGLVLALFAAGPLSDLSFCLMSAAFRAVVWRRPRPGTYPVCSLLYLRKWSADFLMGASRTAVLPLYTTLYLPPWLRLLGARVGARAELSTVSQISPEGLDIGEESFLADGVVIGRRRMFDGCFQIDVNRIGRRTFVGNNALMPVGASLGPHSLLGVLSTPPADGAAEGEGMDWLGSPAFRLPSRQKVGGFRDDELFRPSRGTYARRLFVDGIRIVAPGIITTSGLIGFLAAAYGIYLWLGIPALVLSLPILSFCVAMLEYLAVVLMKLLFMGRFRPVVKPLWSPYVWLNEAVNGSYETVAVGALSSLLGTPFIGPLLRLLGCKVGRRVFLASILFSEFDLIEIGDHAAINLGAVLQTHLFEDRIMKSSFVRVEDECAIGNHAVVLYDTLLQQGSKVAPLSLVMKGEVLPPFSSWSGIPIGSRVTASSQP